MFVASQPMQSETRTKNVQQRGTYYYYLFAFLALMAFFLLTYPDNRSENDDGFSYAAAVRFGSWTSLFEPRYLMFLPFSRSVFLLVQNFGGTFSDPYLVMCYVSSVCAALTLLMVYRFMRKVLELSVINSIWGGIILLCCYSFWRYAVEAEVYSISNLLCITVLYLLMRTNSSRLLRIAGAGILGGIAVLLYKPNVIPLFFCFPLLFVLGRRFKAMFLYGGAGVITVLAGYYLVFSLVHPPADSFTEFLTRGASYSPGSPLMSVFVLGSDVAATNFLYGIPGVRTFIAQHFPTHVISEEIYAASRHGRGNYIPLATCIALLGVIGWIIVRYRKHIGFSRQKPVVVVLIIWPVMYAAMLLFLDPTSPEPWMMLVMPLVIFVAYWTRFLFGSRQTGIVWLLAGLLLVHNWLGGYRIIADEKGDYIAHNVGWLKTNAKENDLVVSLSASTTLAYIDYYTPATITAPEQNMDRSIMLMNEAIKEQRKIYFMDDMLHPDPAIIYRNKAACDRVASFVERYRSYLVLVNPADEKQGKVYEFTYKGALQ
ncbi:protein O-mannosyl-transferase family [Chitinophaga arvensicola]|uniref:Dolichyl-phosphate-mannose-protein mannosyltransferase n=1 Tax=Chitinophaga arvensicola TaxID=29529 RepID=A0A1I0S5P0_9BACT|nr:DUF2723 domain-containing protein [Chitinophaga arvensicola]SEW50324.1 Protein of unknown function [Chitinophaga arvensicola]